MKIIYKICKEKMSHQMDKNIVNKNDDEDMRVIERVIKRVGRVIDVGRKKVFRWKDVMTRYRFSCKRLAPICEEGDGCVLIYGNYPYQFGRYRNYDCTSFCHCLHPGETRSDMTKRVYSI